MWLGLGLAVSLSLMCLNAEYEIISWLVDGPSCRQGAYEVHQLLEPSYEVPRTQPDYEQFYAFATEEYTFASNVEVRGRQRKYYHGRIRDQRTRLELP